jgi:secreted Zn-dependent insulinase-like peptidase
MAPPAVEPPHLLFNSTEGTLWHRTETAFGLPMCAMHVLWSVPRVAASAHGAVRAQLLELMVREQLRATSYDAGVAGSTFSFGASARGFELSAYGFSQRVPVLLSTLLDTVVGLEADGAAARRRFATQKTMLARGLADADKQSPQGLASQISQHMTRKLFYLPEQLLEALEPVTLADLANFTRLVTAEDPSAVEGLVLGNHDGQAATAMLTAASQKLVAAELPFAQRPRQAVADLSGRHLVHTFRHPNGDEPNSAAQLVVQFGRLDARQAAVAELLSDMLKQPFFDELRTKQQLGYIVGSGLSAPQAVYALGFVVQSAVQPPAEVSRRILAFLASAPQILANASDEFPSYVAAAQTQLREPPKRLSQAADMLWPRVSEGTYRFGWPQKVARAMDDVTLADVQALLARLLAAPGAEGAKGAAGLGRLLVLVHGKDHLPLPTADQLAAKIGPLGGEAGWAHVEDAKAFRGETSFFTALMDERPPVTRKPAAAAAADAAAPRKGAAQPTLAAASHSI